MKINFKNIQRSFVHIFGGGVLTEGVITRNIRFIIAISVIMFVFIGYRYGVIRQISELERLQDELEIVMYEAAASSAELTEAGRQSEIERRVEEAGLDIKISTEPVYIIKK